MIVQCKARALIIRSLPQIGNDTDTGKRMIHAQTAAVHGYSLDSKWSYVDAPAARGWVSNAHIGEFDATDLVLPTTPAWPKVPNGKAEIIRIFGNPGTPICQSGRVILPGTLRLSWQRSTLISVFACHKLLEDVFTSVFKELYDRGLWSEIEDYGGCYADRAIRGASNISTHSWGISIDINTLTNPLGKVPKMNPKITAIFKDHGFKWGGEFKRPDGMHYQYATGY